MILPQGNFNLTSINVDGGVLNFTGLTFTNVQGNTTISSNGLVSIDQTSSVDFYGILISELFLIGYDGHLSRPLGDLTINDGGVLDIASNGDVQVRGCLNIAGATLNIGIRDTDIDKGAKYPRDIVLPLINVPSQCINGEPKEVNVQLVNNDCVVASEPRLDLSSSSTLAYLVQLDTSSVAGCGILSDANTLPGLRWAGFALLFIFAWLLHRPVTD